MDHGLKVELVLDHMRLTPWLPQVLTSWSWSHTKALGIKRLEFNAKNQEAGKNHHLYNVEESPPQKHVLLHQERMSVVFRQNLLNSTFFGKNLVASMRLKLFSKLDCFLKIEFVKFKFQPKIEFLKLDLCLTLILKKKEKKGRTRV